MYRFKPLTLALIILIFGFLETSLLASLPLWNAKIELLLMLVVFLSLFSFKKQIYVCAFFCGLLKDIFSILPFGISTFLFMLIAFYIEKVSKNFFKEDKLIFGGFVFIVTFFSGFISFFLSGDIKAINFFRILTGIILPTSFISTLVSPLIFSFFKLILIKNESKPR